jgi:hypothetical protein
MWPAAIVALMVGGPLGACLFLAAGITHIMKVSKIDAEYARRGELPPTARLVNAWLDRKKAAGQVPASAKVKPYGSVAYAKQRWSAFWEDLGDSHREQHEAYRQAKAEAKKNGLPAPVKPSAKEKPKGWKWTISKLIEPVGGGTNPEPVGNEPPDADGKVVPDGPWIVCPDCGATLADTSGGWQHPKDSTCPKALPEPQAARPPQPGPKGDGVTTCPRCGGPVFDHASDRETNTLGRWCPTCDQVGNYKNNMPWPTNCPDCKQSCYATDVKPRTDLNRNHETMPVLVHYLNDSPACPTPDQAKAAANTKAAVIPDRQPHPAAAKTPAFTPEGETMTAPTTQQSGEVVGLQSAINFADAVAAAHAAHSTGGGEQYRASLAQANVGPETIQSAATAQELSAMAAGAWTAHAAKLREQLAAKEHTTAETGTKEFLLND